MTSDIDPTSGERPDGQPVGRPEGRPEARMVAEVLSLLSRALEAPDALHDIGQEAALLWWALDSDAQHAGEPTDIEAALLDLAMWHIRDERLGRQRGTSADFAAHRDRLLALEPRPQDPAFG
jgi:hypothetical protein